MITMITMISMIPGTIFKDWNVSLKFWHKLNFYRRELIFVFSTVNLQHLKRPKLSKFGWERSWDVGIWYAGDVVCFKNHGKLPKYYGRQPKYDGRQPKIGENWPFYQDALWPRNVLISLVMIRKGHRITCIGSGWPEDSGRWPRYDGRRLRYDGRRPR